MKKIAGLLMALLLFGLAGLQVMEAKKKEIFVLCRQIVSPQVLESIIVKKKKLKNGIRIAMTSRDKKKLQVLKGLIETCKKEAETLKDDTKHYYELLYRKSITCTITDVKSGFQLEMVSDDAELVKKIKKVYLPIVRRHDDVTSNQEGELNIVEEFQ
jgi:hypothetical protein